MSKKTTLSKKATQTKKDTAVDKLLHKAIKHHTSNNSQEAEKIYREILNKNPKQADALNLLGLICFNSKRLMEAVYFHKAAIKYQPEKAIFHYNLGNAYTELEQLEEALELYKKAAKLDPDNKGPLRNCAVLFWKVGRLQEAEQILLSSMEDQNKDCPYYITLGNIYHFQGKLSKAKKIFKQGLELGPEHPLLHLNLGLIQLSQDNYTDGWENYSWRLQPPDPLQSCLSSNTPIWNGSKLTDKNILVYKEQGIGDDIMFAQFLPEIAELSNKCFVMCGHRLVPLYKRSFPNITVIPPLNPDELITFTKKNSIDFASPIGELAKFLRPNIGSFTKPKSYLKADRTATKKWEQRYFNLGKGLKIGISWQGGLKNETFKSRSIDLEHWVNLFNLPNCHFINIQYGEHSKEIQQLKDKNNITLHHWEDSNPLKNMDDFAAQISALDLVISVDNSSVHLAAALGIPVWVLLPSLPEWRWGIRKQSSLWYASITLFHQRIAKNWTPVFSEIIDRLSDIQSNDAYLPYFSFENLPTAILIDPCHNKNHLTTVCTQDVLTQMLCCRVLNVQNISSNELSILKISTTNPEDIYRQTHLESFYQENKSLFQKIELSTYLVINGDGLLGSSHNDALKLLIIAYITKKLCEKPVYLINFSLNPDLSKNSPISNATYLQLFSSLDGISTQDRTSDNFLTQANITHNTSFSLIPWYIENNYSFSSIEKDNSIILTNIHHFNNTTLTELAHYIKLISNSGFALKLLIDPNLKSSDLNSTFVQSLPSGTEKNWDFVYAYDVETWLYTLAQSKLVVSNQHSDLIASSYLNTPCLPLDNTFENNNYTHQLGILSPIDLTTNNLSEQLVQNTLKILKNPKLFEAPKLQLNELRQLSKKILDF